MLKKKTSSSSWDPVPPATPLIPESLEEAISLLCLLRANHSVSLAQLNLFNSKIDQSAAHVEYYKQQAGKARKCIEDTKYAVGYGWMVITQSGYLYKAIAGSSCCWFLYVLCNTSGSLRIWHISSVWLMYILPLLQTPQNLLQIPLCSDCTYDSVDINICKLCT